MTVLIIYTCVATLTAINSTVGWFIALRQRNHARAEVLRAVLNEVDVAETGNPPLRYDDAVRAIRDVAARRGVEL